jgi:hypothetical protein
MPQQGKGYFITAEYTDVEDRYALNNVYITFDDDSHRH